MTLSLTDKIRLVALINAFILCVLITAFYEYGVYHEKDGGLTIRPIVDEYVSLVMIVLGCI